MIPFFGLNSTEGSSETNSNLILKSKNDFTLRSVTANKFDALEILKKIINSYFIINVVTSTMSIDNRRNEGECSGWRGVLATTITDY